MDQLLNACSECNNIGVTLLLGGRYRDALITFKTAALILQPVSTLTTPNESISDLDWQTFQRVQDAQNRLASFLSASKADDDYLGHNMYALAGPIRINKPSKADPFSCVHWCSTIIFNMALAYQLEQTVPCVQKALVLMESALSLIGGCDADITSPSAMAVAAACLNNCGVIHHGIGDYRKSRKCLEALSAFIFPSAASTLPPILLGRDEDYEWAAITHHRLILNTIFLTEPTIAGAA